MVAMLNWVDSTKYPAVETHSVNICTREQISGFLAACNILHLVKTIIPTHILFINQRLNNQID